MDKEPTNLHRKFQDSWWCNYIKDYGYHCNPTRWWNWKVHPSLQDFGKKIYTNIKFYSWSLAGSQNAKIKNYSLKIIASSWNSNSKFIKIAISLENQHIFYLCRSHVRNDESGLVRTTLWGSRTPLTSQIIWDVFFVCSTLKSLEL